MVPLHFLTPRYDLPVVPGQHQLPGPAADAAAPRLGLRRGAAARRRPAAGAHRPDRHRRHLALAGDARLRQDQRGLGPRAARPLGAQRQAGAAVVHRPRHLPRRRPGRLRDPHLHQRRRRRARPRRAAALRARSRSSRSAAPSRRWTSRPEPPRTPPCHISSILYTKNLEAETDCDALCRALADVMVALRDEDAQPVFPTGGVRVLAYPAAHSPWPTASATTPSST